MLQLLSKFSIMCMQKKHFPVHWKYEEKKIRKYHQKTHSDTKKNQKRADEKLKQLKFSDQPTKEKQQFVFSCVNLDIQDQYVSVIIETRRSEDRKKILFNKFRCRLRLKKSFYIHRLS